jgi:mannosyltransferase OCH1-like enzyme
MGSKTKRRGKAKTKRRGKAKRIDKTNRDILAKENKTIHQIYGIFDDGVPLKDIKVFYDNVQKTKQFCRDHTLKQPKMWNLKMCDKLIETKFPTYKQLWVDLKRKKTDTNPHFNPIMAADFIRYCILYDQGGIYIDCDIHPIGTTTNFHKLFKNDYFFVRWNNDKKKLPYNAVMGSQKGQQIFKDIMDECKGTYYKLVDKPIYKKWKGRFIFQVTGHYMIQRVLKRKDYKQFIMEHDLVKDILKVKSKSGEVICAGGSPCRQALFEDSNASVWFKG